MAELRVLKVGGTSDAPQLRVLRVTGSSAASGPALRVLRVGGVAGYTVSVPELRVLRVAGSTSVTVLADGVYVGMDRGIGLEWVHADPYIGLNYGTGVAWYDFLDPSNPTEPPPPVNVPPVARVSLSAADLVVTANGAASTDVDGTIVAYAFDWGDGSPVQTGSLASRSHTYTTGGAKTVTLTVTDDDGATHAASSTATIAANQAPVPALAVTVTNMTVTANAAGSTDPDGSITAYTFNWGDGQTQSGTTTSRTHTYTTAGTKTITLTVTDNDGATASLIRAVTVPPVTATSTVMTKIGTCPIGFDAPATQSPPGTSGTSGVITDFGTGAAVRQFSGSSPSGAVSRPAGASIVHTSWKATPGSIVSDAAIITAFANLRDGDLVEVLHEWERKDQGYDNQTPYRTTKEAFHASVVRLRDAGSIPAVRTVNTLTGWSLDSRNTDDRTVFLCAADLLGVDLDGYPVYPGAGPEWSGGYYFPFVEQCRTKILSYVQIGGYSGWTVPEFTHSAYPTGDPTRSIRIAWMQAQVAGLMAASIPPAAIMFFNFNHLDNNEGLITTAERQAWKDIVTDEAAKAVVKEKALRLTSTAENSTLNWTTAYQYIEDIGDGRGYTAGICGFCSGTGDMLTLIEHYNAISPGNPLQQFTDELTTIMGAAYGNRPALSHSLLDPQGFVAAWQAAATGRPMFRQAQRDERDRVYWAPAYANAVADGVGALGVAIHYDISINHGPGTQPDAYGGIVATARAAATRPSQGGNETAYLNALIDAREDALLSWGISQAEINAGRVGAHRQLVNAGKLQLQVPYTWTMYGDTFTETVNPTPVPG